ncbi:hypothetical protein BJY52DRAFT_325759 [Lactarius psammicola]|nr:hypothetical protein BJY52DRAFT_325759 [Lactarius psammicola]
MFSSHCLRLKPRRRENSFFGGGLFGSLLPTTLASSRAASVFFYSTSTSHATISYLIRPSLFTSGIKGPTVIVTTEHRTSSQLRVRCEDGKVAVVILCSVNGIFIFFARCERRRGTRRVWTPLSACHPRRHWLSSILPIAPAARSQCAGGAYPACVCSGGFARMSAAYPCALTRKCGGLLDGLPQPPPLSVRTCRSSPAARGTSLLPNQKKKQPKLGFKAVRPNPNCKERGEGT